MGSGDSVVKRTVTLVRIDDAEVERPREADVHERDYENESTSGSRKREE